MGFLLNRRNAFRSSGSAVFSSWTFDITKTTYDNVSTVPRTSAKGAAPSGMANFRYLRMINDGASLVAGAGSNSYVYLYHFDLDHPGEINYLDVGYSGRSASIPYLNALTTDHTGRNWFAGRYDSVDKIRKVATDSAFDVSSVKNFPLGSDELNSVPPGRPYGLAISNDGKSLFALAQDDTRSFVKYTLETPNLLSSSLVTSQSVPMVTFAGAAAWNSFFFSPDGYRIVFTGSTHVFVFDLPVAWDISGMKNPKYLNFLVAFGIDDIAGGCVNNDGTKLYLSLTDTNAIHQFSLSE
jgi:hypothetical protein